ncbi:MAG: peptide chain release factor 2 [bacterium]
MATELDNLGERLQALGPKLGIEAKRIRLPELEAASQASDLWEDQEKAVKTMSELNELQATLSQWDDLEGFLGMVELSEDDLISLDKELTVLEQKALLSGVHDARGAILTIHAGTGGVDAQDFAEMLERMFLRYVEQGSTEQPEERTLSVDRHNWKVDIVERTRGEEAGLKRAVLEIQGSNAFGLLKSEAGVHRLVRMSPFNAKGLRQTSFALVEVIPEMDASAAANIDEKDLRIDVFRSSGKGGQGVNTTDSAVRLTHLPSGLVVSVQNERSQHQNKATAMKILLSKLERLRLLQDAEETAILKGEFKEGSWGNQIRSYVMQPYQLVKDHRTEYETSDVQGVLDGELSGFIEAYLKSDSNISA